MNNIVKIIGGGLAGCECAYQLAKRGIKVKLFEMKPNTISNELVKSNYGYHIIKVTDRIEAGTTPFVKVKEDIKFYLETQEQVKVLKDFTDGLMKTAKIDYVDESYNVEKLLKEKAKQTKEDEK